MKGPESIVLAAYGIPGVLGARCLLERSIPAKSISFLTYPSDDRNEQLHRFANDHDIELVTYNAKSQTAFGWLKSMNPDLLCSLHYRDRIPERMLNIPRRGCVNLHPSLLPKYRGCFSIPWAIINGEKETGFTYHYMTKNFDDGKIVLQRVIPIEDRDTAYSLFQKQVTAGLSVFWEVVRKVIDNPIGGTPQIGEPSYYPRRLPYDGYIRVEWDNEKVARFIRAMEFPPHKGAIVKLGDVEYEVHSLDDYHRAIAGFQK